MRPLDHCREEVRMRDRNRHETAVPAHERLVLREQRQAIPQDVAAGRLDEQRTLADREFGLDPDSGELRLDFADVGAVLRADVVQRRPLLSLLRDVLTLVTADRALARRLVRSRVLRAARRAEEARHDNSNNDTVSTCGVCGNMSTARARTSL